MWLFVEGIPQRLMSCSQSVMSSTSSVSMVGSVLDEVLAAVVASTRNVNEAANLSSEIAVGVDEIEEVEPSRPTTSVPTAGQAIPLLCI